MKINILLIVLLAVTFMAGTQPAFAQSGTVTVYVDPARTGANEDGSQNSPYNSVAEGKAYAQSLPNGGWLNVKNADGTWTKTYISPVVSGATGTPLPNVTLYILLGVLALLLMLTGWYFLRRSRQSQV